MSYVIEDVMVMTSDVALRAIDRDAHGLRVLVDIDRDFGASRRGKAGREHQAERGGTHVS